MIGRGRIGFSTPPTRVAIDAWRVKLFCQAIGETDPVYWDDDVARAAGHAACPVPPTFLKAVEGEHFSSASLMAMLEAPLTGVLHAEQSFEHHHPVHVGDVVEVSRKVSQIYDKKDGAFTFIVVETDYVHDGRSAARSLQTILVRNVVVA
ncbi:MaoC family dehydratase N-terminal domain-containing protein [Variovorax paradoxus]|nr:MaoC family dehydratase N-terminal domain-containing protein [Variovorax paradoxus]MBT2301921.1 MaoC family dehydratase N-terminal domain-containing protein [Variovorax paradoxus]